MTFGVLAREIAEAGTDRDRAALAAVLRDAATDDENDAANDDSFAAAKAHEARVS